MVYCFMIFCSLRFLPYSFCLSESASIAIVAQKKQNEEVPGTFAPEETKRRKIMLIIASVVAGVLVAVVIGFIALLFMAVAFM